jgi:hypothetical protein
MTTFKGIQVYNTCLFSISPEPISNTQMFIYFVYYILIIVHLLQGNVMEKNKNKNKNKKQTTKTIY